MKKKFIIICFVFVGIGFAVFSWASVSEMKFKQLQQKHQQLTETNLQKLDKIITGSEKNIDLRETISNDDEISNKLARYEGTKETRELARNLSIFVMLLSVTGILGLAVINVGKIIILLASKTTLKVNSRCKNETRTESVCYAEKDKKESKKPLRPWEESGWQTFSTSFVNPQDFVQTQKEIEKAKEELKKQKEEFKEKIGFFEQLSSDPEKLDSLFSTEKTTDSSKEPFKKAQKPVLEINTDECDEKNQHVQLQKALTAQNVTLQKQVNEFNELAKDFKKVSNRSDEPINDTLKELSEQVSAIKEYALSQQERVTKLQDGYDWNIIKNFCLRVIRCIDNIESRMSLLNSDQLEYDHLEQVRDELLFALESSGIEPFEPVLDSEYRGQEKVAEAVKERCYCEDTQKKGKIAEIIRAGYQYVIDDDNCKIVRAARVKLYS